MAKNERREVILEIGVEGGSIALLGFRDTQGAWRFTLRKNESGAFALLPEEEQVGSPVSESTPYLSWTEALRALNHNRHWHRLRPVALHPDFEGRVLAEVKHRGGEEEVRRWRETLRNENQPKKRK
jgi:hypothetical protein